MYTYTDAHTTMFPCFHNHNNTYVYILIFTALTLLLKHMAARTFVRNFRFKKRLMLLHNTLQDIAGIVIRDEEDNTSIQSKAQLQSELQVCPAL